MEKIYCAVREKYFYSDESCWYQQGRIPDISKVCAKCDHYKFLQAKAAAKITPEEKAINQFSKVSHTPKENVRFYLHIYKKINEARKDNKSLIKPLQKMVNDQSKLLGRAIKDEWLLPEEALFIWKNWLNLIGKEKNKGKFSMMILENHFVKKEGKKTNPALEFLSRALLSDAEEFGKGKPHYKEISKFLSSINKRSYTVSTLKDKYPILKIPGLKFNEPTKKFKVELIINTLIATKTYFDANRKPFLPDSIPTIARGYVKTILKVLSAASEYDRIPKHRGIRIPTPKR